MRETDPLRPAAVANTVSFHPMSPKKILNMGRKAVVSTKRAMNMKMKMSGSRQIVDASTAPWLEFSSS